MAAYLTLESMVYGDACMTHKMPLTLAFNKENSYEDPYNTPYLTLSYLNLGYSF